jgi:predicted transcriptional regulator
MKSYLKFITEQADEVNIPLLAAFKEAKIQTSTYYRAINGDTEIRYETALRVHHAIKGLHLLQQAREYTKRLRADGKHVDKRKVKAKLKPRQISS